MRFVRNGIQEARLAPPSMTVTPPTEPSKMRLPPAQQVRLRSQGNPNVTSHERGRDQVGCSSLATPSGLPVLLDGALVYRVRPPLASFNAGR